MDKNLDVYGIGNPLIDFLSIVKMQFLDEIGLNKGIMHLIDIDRREFLISKLPNPAISPGGSCANTIIALAGFEKKTIYGGGIGDDDLGEQFERNIIDLQVKSALQKKSLATGTSIILITEDAERTQNTYLGACQEFSSIDVNVDAIKSSKILYFTGYMWDTQSQKEALNYAIDVAEESNTSIMFDVADPFAVNRSKDDFVKIMKNHTDFVFANFEEAKTLTKKTNMEDVIAKMQDYTEKGVVKDGAKGSVVFDQNGHEAIDVYKVHAVDTTGAGDMYAAGFLFGLLQNYDMKKCGDIASLVGAKVVEQIGPRLDYSISEFVNNSGIM